MVVEGKRLCAQRIFTQYIYHEVIMLYLKVHFSDTLTALALCVTYVKTICFRSSRWYVSNPP